MAEDSGTRNKILEAAARTAQSVGSSRLTIDAVAKAAKVSKGGVLYHFPTKYALLAGLMDYSIEQFESRTREQELQLEGRHKLIRSLIRAAQKSVPEQRTLPLSVLTAAAEDKTLLAPVKKLSQSWCEAVEEESEWGLLLLLAIEGLQFLEMLDLVDLSAEKRHAIFQQMLRVAECSDNTAGADHE